MGSGIVGLNVSEKHKTIWLAPERTGSRKVAEVLSYYGFTNDGFSVFRYGQYRFSHYCNAVDKYLGYELICNTRNPYSRVYAIFKNLYAVYVDKSKESFKKYLTQDLQNGQTINMVINPPIHIKPKYVIRLEHMTEDLLKLPFIFDVLTENQLRLLSSHEKPIDKWEEFYDEESKEIVYNMLKPHFDYFGYEK